jgi:4a-hydroxytetrahydrobiopterin dehydratase
VAWFYFVGDYIMRVLTINEVKQYLERLDDWHIDGDAIKREWVFKDFSEAVDFINMIAVIAENHNHHPEIHNEYNRVSLRFNTHDAGGITKKDINIATTINKL